MIFFNKPTTKMVDVSYSGTSNIYSIAANTDIAVEVVSENTPGPGTCSTSTASVSAETPAQPAAASGYVSDLGEKATGPKHPIPSSFPKHQIGDNNRAFSPFYYGKFP